jgi:hypothetical protein
MSKTSCASRCSRRSVQGALRAPAEGEGRLARREDLTAAAAATLERGGSRGGAGTVAHGTRAARERRRRRAKVSRRRRAGRAPPARPGRSSRVPRIRTPGGPMVGAPLHGRRADDFFLGLGFPPVNWGSISCGQSESTRSAPRESAPSEAKCGDSDGGCDGMRSCGRSTRARSELLAA